MVQSDLALPCTSDAPSHSLRNLNGVRAAGFGLRSEHSEEFLNLALLRRGRCSSPRPLIVHHCAPASEVFARTRCF